jgi:hypothetical protein
MTHITVIRRIHDRKRAAAIRLVRAGADDAAICALGISKNGVAAIRHEVAVLEALAKSYRGA